jgi:hypothetical protein
MREEQKYDGAYVAMLVCAVVALLASNAHFKKTARLPFQPPPPFRPTPDGRPGPRTPLELALDRGEAIYRGPADPTTNIVAIGPKGPDGRIVPLAYETRDGMTATVVDAEGNVTWRARRPDVAPSSDPFTTRHHEAMDSKSLAELIREINARLVDAHRQHP